MRRVIGPRPCSKGFCTLKRQAARTRHAIPYDMRMRIHVCLCIRVERRWHDVIHFVSIFEEQSRDGPGRLLVGDGDTLWLAPGIFCPNRVVLHPRYELARFVFQTFRRCSEASLTLGVKRSCLSQYPREAALRL